MNQSNLKLLIIKIQGRFEFWQKIADDPSCFIQKDCFKESSKQANDLEMDFSTIIYQQKKLLQARNRLYVKNAEILIPIILITSLVGILISVIAYMGLQKEITNKQDNFLQLDKLKNELEAKIEQLNESNDELDRFAYIASHDLQEPLRKIISFSETLVKNHPKELNNDSKVYLGIISNASLRMKRLIEDLLNYSRLIPTSNSVTEQVNLNETVSTVLKDLELTFKEKNAKITIDDLPTIIGIKFQLNQLFLNLISNSLKYASADRSPEIHIFNSPVNTIVDDTFNPVAGIDYCQIEISDNGIGFEEKDEKEIFKIFNRLHGRNEYDGTGIGLAICKRVVENHKGYIKAHGKLNIGASFSIILPLNS
ncbi:ATP-binding protein [Solitalea sp. MAHUQ-68]|uniref:histidine kinase n=1 Tax=Solitalea agri TaxID=2953739 RepID=A0A9X2F5I9_9SPHI|nr:ATP-binding protein [Solitalea agri]MCO4294645.1 ATP-binding protein [Solitalea agri]